MHRAWTLAYRRWLSARSRRSGFSRTVLKFRNRKDQIAAARAFIPVKAGDRIKTDRCDRAGVGQAAPRQRIDGNLGPRRRP